jgi:ABC-type nitrate/sulfonate/bicarbonate transport system substrate-binding protein
MHVAPLALFGICLLAAAVWIAGCAQPLVPLRVATSLQPGTANLHAAEILGQFEKHGLAVRLDAYPSGKAALEAVLRGEADLATVAETPVMDAVVGGADLRCYASLSESRTAVSILGRRDLGIHTEVDLLGATIGLPRGTNAEIYLRNHLAFVGLPV